MNSVKIGIWQTPWRKVWEAVAYDNHARLILDEVNVMVNPITQIVAGEIRRRIDEPWN